MDMPKIESCDVTQCAYNQNNTCHALAITVGDPSAPMCDTFWNTDAEGGDPSHNGRVGACHMNNCMFNEKLECQSSNGIRVGMKGAEADCMTFKSQ